MLSYVVGARIYWPNSMKGDSVTFTTIPVYMPFDSGIPRWEIHSIGVIAEGQINQSARSFIPAWFVVAED